MTKLLDQSIRELRDQPDEVAWSRLFGDPLSEDWLTNEAAAVRAAIAKGETRPLDFDVKDA